MSEAHIRSCASRSPGRRVSGWRCSRGAGRRGIVAFIARNRDGVESVARERPVPSASSATSRARTISIRSRYRCSGLSAGSTSSSTTPPRLARCRSRRSPTPTVKTWSSPWRPTCRSIPPDEGAPRIAGRVSARRTAAAGSQRVERRRRHRLCRLGRLRRQQGCAPSSQPDLERGACLGRHPGRRIDPGDMDTPLHALAVPDADRSR